MSAAATFSAFLSDVQEPGTPQISPARFAKRLSLEQQQLAILARVHRNTVNRMPSSPALQKFLREALRVIAAAADLNGDSQRALYWFRNQPIADFGYKTPETIVSEGKTDELVRYIEAIGAGSAG